MRVFEIEEPNQPDLTDLVIVAELAAWRFKRSIARSRAEDELCEAFTNARRAAGTRKGHLSRDGEPMLTVRECLLLREVRDGVSTMEEAKCTSAFLNSC